MLFRSTELAVPVGKTGLAGWGCAGSGRHTGGVLLVGHFTLVYPEPGQADRVNRRVVRGGVAGLTHAEFAFRNKDEIAQIDPTQDGTRNRDEVVK